MKNHAFFSDIDWNQIAACTHQAHFVPRVKGNEDTSCIDKLFTREGLEETYIDPNALSNKEKQKAHFDGFTYAPPKAI